MTGLELITRERNEQIEKHGFTITHDKQYNDQGQLSEAASILSLSCWDWGCKDIDDMVEDHCPEGWDRTWWRMMLEKPHFERIIIAGALIAAEIDRLQSLKSEL